METALENSTDSWNISEGHNLELKCGLCSSGHWVKWYVEPPPECPICNAEFSPAPSDFCLLVPGLS
jgi:uncharacterized protein (DUF983 family)